MPSIELVTIGLLRELTSGDAIVTLAGNTEFSSFGEEDDAVLEAQMFLSEYLATAEPEIVARFALPEGTHLATTDVLVPRDDLPRRWNITQPIRFTSLVIPTLPNTKGKRDRWVVILPLLHTFFVRVDEDLDDAVESEVKRIVAARELGPVEYLELLPPRSEHVVKLETTITRAGADAILGGANRQKRIAELEAKRYAVAVLDSVADALHAGIPVGRVDPAPFPLRDAEIENLRLLLAGKERASVLVVGKERVGKSGLLRAWLEREHELNRPRIVYQTSGARLVAGMSGFGQWQERVRRVMEAAALVDAILYFDDLADLFADRPGGHVDIPSAMRPYLEDARVRVVGEVREEFLDRLEQQNGGFFACFGRVRIEPLSGKQALTILNQLSAVQIERDSDRAVLTNEGNASLVELAERYLPYESFPGKAVRLAREITAAHEIAMGSTSGGARVGPDVVHEAFSVRTGVPTFLLRDETSLRVGDVIKELEKRLVGQDEAVRRVAELVCIVKAGLQPAGKPLATLLFVGPTGVGKTELARALAGLLFGGEERLVRFDMSEYASAYATERLFRGNDGGEGLLTRKVREQPFCVILLDEIEKAHPAAFDLLLQVCGEGRLTDGRGKTAYFHNAILIMTSNLGATHRRNATGFGTGGDRRATDEAHYAKVVRETFRPEFVNRIDRVVAFRTLVEADIQAVARIATARTTRRRGIVQRGIDLVVSDEATAHLAKTGMSDVYGARALRRHVERELVTPIARLISAKGGLDGERIVVATTGAETESGEEPGDEQSGLRFGVVHVPARRSRNAAYVLGQITEIRRQAHRQSRLDRVRGLRDQTAFLVAQLGYNATALKKRKKRAEPPPDGPEIAQMTADHARYAELLAALDGALSEVFAIEELALSAFVAGEALEPFKQELDAPMKKFRAALVRVLVAEEQHKNSITLMVKEVDDRRAFDLWLIPLLHDVARRKWVVAVHLDADKERPATWPADRRWGPPLDAEQAIARLERPDRTYRNVMLSVEGDHARVWLGLEAGTHRFVNFSGRAGDAFLHIGIVAERSHLTNAEWTPPVLDPPNAQVAEALAKEPLIRHVDSQLANITVPLAHVPHAEYWPRYEDIALAQLLLYERTPGLSREKQYAPMLQDRFFEVRAEIKKGNKIHAIKIYREITRCGLREAKEAVEAMEMTASFSVPVYQKRLGDTVELTTLGLGASTLTTAGQGIPKAEENLRRLLKETASVLRPGELGRFDLKRGTRLERVQLEVNLKDARKRRVSGLCPLIIEPRHVGGGRTMEICYHPAYQGQWFPHHPYEALSMAAAAYFAGVWANLPDSAITALWSNTKDSLKIVSFSVKEKTLLAELPDKKKGIWDDLEANPLEAAKKDRGAMSVLPRLGADLTPPMASIDVETLGMPRPPYREQLQVLLGARPKQSVILVGPPGCGKSTIIRRLVSDLLVNEDYASHQNLDKVTHVWRILGKQLIAGMSKIGQWEQRCVELLDDLRGRAIVLTIPDLHLFGRIGRARDSDRALSDFFRGPVARGEMVILGECTPEQLQRLEEDDPSFAAGFVKIHVAASSKNDTFRMMLTRARELEVTSAVAINPLAFETILDLGEGLFPHHALPGKAVDLLTRVAKRGGLIDDSAIVSHLTATTGLPMHLLSPKKPLSSEEVAKALGERVIGQPEAVREAADLVVRIRSGLVDSKRPWGVYLFTGPTGTGKTELAKALSEYLYGTDGARLVRLDMSELAGPDGVSRLIGDAWDPDGRLTSAVLAQPFCVVLLDEIEKAHPAVLNLLLQLFDDGRLTDAAGNTASFTQTVVVMTSNLGARQRPPVGFDEATDGLLQDVARAVREFFPPELFNRIDAVVPFKPLTPEVAVQVTRKELGKLFARPGLVDRNAFVQVADAAIERIAQDSLRAEDGARSLKRYIEDRVGTILGEQIAAAPNAAMQVLRIADTRDGLVVESEPLVEAKPIAGRYELESLWNRPLTELRDRLPEAIAMLDRIESSDRLNQLCDLLRHHLGEHNRGKRESGELLYNIDWMRLAIEKLRDKVERLVVASRELHHHAIENSIMARDVREYPSAPWKNTPKPLPGRMRFDFGQAGSWWEIFSAIAETHVLARALEKVEEPNQHAVFVELVPFGNGRRLMHDMLDAYATARGEVVDVAWTEDGKVESVDGRAGLTTAKLSTGAIVLKIVGLCVADYLELETGTHVWQPTVQEPELLRVRVLPVGSGDARGHVEAWTAARARADRSATSVLPIVRSIHFDPPVAGKPPGLLEMEDYVLGIPHTMRVHRIADAFATLWLLRLSRVEEG